MLKEELIQLHITCSTKEEAIQKTFAPFVEHGYIEPGYIDDVLAGLEQYGPYIVIAPHIALPHSVLSETVIQPAIGITVLDTPVNFNSVNDPVKYLFPICSNEAMGHMASLEALSKLLSDPMLFDVLDHCENTSLIYQTLKPKGI